MADWDETDLTAEEVRAIWERATPVYSASQRFVVSEAELLYLRPSTEGVIAKVDVHETPSLRALAPATA
jgi:hypothetical protein